MTDLIKSNRKGQFGTFVDLMFLALIIFGGGAMGMLLMSSSLSQTIALHMNDLNTVSESSTYGDFYTHDFIPRSVRLSEQNAAYQLGQNGGQLSWTRSSIPFSDLESRLSQEMEPEIRSRLENYMKKSGNEIRCDVQSDYSVSVDEEETSLQGQKPNISCSSNYVSSTYGLPQSIEVSHKTRYFTLAEDMENLAVETKDRLPDGGLTGTGSEDSGSCKDPAEFDKSILRESAKEESRNDAISGYSSVLDNIESSVDFSSEVELTEKNMEFKPGRSGAVQENEETNECEYFVGCPEGEEYDPDEDICRDGDEEGADPYEEGEQYSVEYSYTAEEIEVSYVLEDVSGQILTEDGAQNLEFSIQYDHDLD